MIEKSEKSEKSIVINNKWFKWRLKKIKWKIIPSINKILEKDNSLEWANKWYEIIFKYIRNEIKNWISKNNSQHIFEIFDTINKLTRELNTKKIYVSYPRRSLEDYDKLNLIEKLQDIVIPKSENNIWNQTDVSWWNCHNWTLLYKEIFDELKINNTIVLFEPQTAHSLLLIELDWTFFIADTEWQNKFNFDRVKKWDTISIWNHLNAYILSLNPLKVDITRKGIDIRQNFKPKLYDKKNEFIDFIDKKERDYFLVEYSDIDEENNSKTLKSLLISFNNQKITLTIEGFFDKDKNISLWINKIPKDANLGNLEIIKYLVKRTNNQIFKDPKIKKELEGMISKIPEWFLQSKSI